MEINKTSMNIAGMYKKINEEAATRKNPKSEKSEKTQSQGLERNNKDTLDLSAAKGLKKLLAEVPELPGRSEKVTNLKEQVEEGKYEVDPQKLAARMLDEYR